MGNKALATRTASFTFLWLKAFLACLVISFLMTSSALRLTPRVKPVSNPLLILLGSFKGFRVLLRPWTRHGTRLFLYRHRRFFQKAASNPFLAP